MEEEIAGGDLHLNLLKEIEDLRAQVVPKPYIIAFPRKFWFAKKYKAKAYFLQNHINTLTAKGEQDDAHIRPWLVIVRLDDSKLYIPNIENRSWIVYPSK